MLDDILVGVAAQPHLRMHRRAALSALEEAAALYERRNQIAHGAWFDQRSSDDPQPVVRFRRWGKRDRSQWTVVELFELADELTHVATRVQHSVAYVASAVAERPDEMQV